MTKRDRNMLLVVVAVVLLGGFWFLLLSPQRKAAADAEAQVASAQQALDAAQQKVTAGRAAQQAFRRDRTTIVKLGRVVPESDDIPTLLTQLQAIADRLHVQFNSYQLDTSAATEASGSSGASDGAVGKQTGTRSTDTVAPLYSPGSVEIAGGLGRTPISLELSGTYFQLEKYLRAVQRFAVLSAKTSQTNGRLVVVDGFSYQPVDAASVETTKKEVSVSPNLKATLSASVYFAPPLETPSAAAAAADPAGTAATPAAGTSTPSTSTGAATVGALR